ncbi:MAG: hypothetical protein RL582_967 [Bacteroidota bacterium]|jgi:hypothetical protein
MYLNFAYKCIIEFKGRGINLSTLIYLAFFAKFFMRKFLRKKRRLYEEIIIVILKEATLIQSTLFEFYYVKQSFLSDSFT